MVLEIAQIDVKPGTEAAFEAAVRQAAPLLCRTRGYVRAELLRSLEIPTRYRLLVQWETVENHTMDFQKSAAFHE